MEDGTYRRFIDFDMMRPYGLGYRYRTTTSAEHTAASVAAAQCGDPVAVSTIAGAHPDPEIRALAVTNLACPDDVLLRIAGIDPSHEVRTALLQRPPGHPDLIEALAINVLTNGHLDIYSTLRLLLHPQTPAQFHAALMDRVYRAGPQFRLHAAAAANNAPAQRRIYLHEQLLSHATRIPYTVDLIDAVLGPEGLANLERVAWLLNHPNRKIARLASHYLHHEGLPRRGTLAEGLRTIGPLPSRAEERAYVAPF